MFIPLNIVERGRKSLICSDPHASYAIPLWHFPLDSQEGVTVSVGCGTVYIFPVG